MLHKVHGVMFEVYIGVFYNFITEKPVYFYFGSTQGKLKLQREITGKMQEILFSMMSGNNAFSTYDRRGSTHMTSNLIKTFV